MYIVQLLYCSELLLLKKLHLLRTYARTPVERYEMWFEIIYWQPCNFCFAYMPGRPKGSSAALQGRGNPDE